MSTIGKLVTETQKAFGRPVRLWLTELGYQSNPPDRIAGVPPQTQATYVAAAAYRAWLTPRVDLLVQYLYRDEPGTDRWQSGARDEGRRSRSPRWAAISEPLAEVARRGSTTTVWGLIRPGSGARAYRLQRLGEAAGPRSAACSARRPTARCGASSRRGWG